MEESIFDFYVNTGHYIHEISDRRTVSRTKSLEAHALPMFAEMRMLRGHSNEDLRLTINTTKDLLAVREYFKTKSG